MKETPVLITYHKCILCNNKVHISFYAGSVFLILGRKVEGNPPLQKTLGDDEEEIVAHHAFNCLYIRKVRVYDKILS